MLILDDFVMLGKTVPEEIKSDGRISVCSAGVSETLRSLIRIYPLARSETPPRWSVSTVPLIRNSKDSRNESFKLAGNRGPAEHERINRVFEIHKAEYPHQRRGDLLKRYVVDSIDEANARRLSLAVVHPDIIDLDFEFNPDSPDSPQLALFDIEPRPQHGAKRFAYIPRLRFKDADREHHLMVRDWGCFEFMRKYGDDRRHELPGALHLTPDCSLLVGNFSRHRNSWLIISVLRDVRAEPNLLDDIEGVAA